MVSVTIPCGSEFTVSAELAFHRHVVVRTHIVTSLTIMGSTNTGSQQILYLLGGHAFFNLRNGSRLLNSCLAVHQFDIQLFQVEQEARLNAKRLF